MENKPKQPAKQQQRLSEEEKAQRAAEKAKRKAEFEAKAKKEKNEDSKGSKPEKSKAELKAERRAIQEAQRAAKASRCQQKPQKIEPNDKKPDTTNQQLKVPVSSVAVEDKKRNFQKQESIISNKELPERILSHLPRGVSDLSKLSVQSIPTTVIKIGYQINRRIIDDPSSRCVAMLESFRVFINGYQPNKDIKRELEAIIFKDSVNFLEKCRPLSISMINAIKHLKSVFARISSELSDGEVRKSVCKSIESFINDEILCSRTAIVDNAIKKIFESSNDERVQTVLTLGCSTIMKKLFLEAKAKGIKFNVVVVDTLPRFEGRKMVEFLTKNSISVTYILINSILYIMKEVTKVMFEAHSVLCNGYVMSTIGASQIALMAQANNVPVVVCCETYKYSDRAYTDCFNHNELGNAAEYFFESKNFADETISNLNYLDLCYDLTPREFISAVITEKGFLPCTSVPAILRFRETIK